MHKAQCPSKKQYRKPPHMNGDCPFSESDADTRYGKRSRENDGTENRCWELSSIPQPVVKPLAGADYKRMRPSFNQLNCSSDRLYDEVLKMKSKMSGIDPLRYQVESYHERIRNLERELLSLKMEIRQYTSESIQVETQLLENRRVIGMLLNRLQQSLGTNQVRGVKGSAD